jgi:3-hydroxyacyl-CoA dehydrogenase
MKNKKKIFSGQKSGAGFYNYSKSQTDGQKNSEGIEACLKKAREKTEKKKIFIPKEMIANFCLYSSVNEATRIFEEKCVETLSDIDLGTIMGFGFPPWR